MTVVGLVHTVSSLAAVFDELVRAESAQVPGSDLQPVHVADPWLLSTVVAGGVDADVEARIARHATHLAALGARAVLVTCSSIGETVTGAGAAAGIPVLRVDGAMAQEAVGLAREGEGRVAVLATLASTLGPTGRLVRAAVDGSGAAAGVTMTVVPGAAAAKAAGDQDGHDLAVRRAVHEAASSADVVVLAQASMASALEADGGVAVPVLTSPRSGVRDLVATVRRGGALR